jgi:hypothetical protein
MIGRYVMKCTLCITILVFVIGSAGCKKDEDPASAGNNSNTAPPAQATVFRTGIFSGQNGYVTSGGVDVLRDSTTGNEFVRTKNDFRVSGGAGTITMWLTNQTGAMNLNSTTAKIEVGAITSGFSGMYTFSIPTPGSSAFTHIVAFCQIARINFGSAALQTL